MPKTCLIHIGTPKTGTSSLQATIFAAREELLNYSINYFDFTENHNLLSEIFETAKNREAHLMSPGVGSKQKTKQALRKAIKANKSDLFIISGEALSMLTKDGIQNLKSFLDPHFDNFKIVAYVRDPFSFASSAAQQLIKAGSFSDRFVENTITRANPGWGNVLPFYQRRIGFFLDVFGKQNLIVKNFTRTKLRNENIIDDFLLTILDYQGDFKRIKQVNKNESLDGDLVRILEQLNINVPALINDKRNPERSNTIIMRLRNYSRTIENKKYVPAKLDLNAFCDVIRDDVQWLGKACGIKFDLTPPDWTENSIDPEKIARIINHLSLALDREKGKQGKVQASYAELQSKFESLHEKYTKLQKNYATSRGNYSSIHEKYTKLQDSYGKSIDNYTTLHEKYTDLQASYVKSKENFTPLNEKYTKLQKTFAKSKNNYISLHEKYTKLQKTYAKSKNNHTTIHEKYTQLQSSNDIQNQKIALLTQRILISKGKSDEETFTKFLKTVNQLDALKSTATALSHEGRKGFVKLINKRIQNIENGQKKLNNAPGGSKVETKKSPVKPKSAPDGKTVKTPAKTSRTKKSASAKPKSASKSQPVAKKPTAAEVKTRRKVKK